MENCPYCNEFMEIAADSQNCPHKSIDPKNEWCCLNCNTHFDLALEEVPIDDSIAISPSTPSTNPTQNPSEKDSSAQSSPSTKDENDSSQESSKKAILKKTLASHKNHKI